MAVLWDEISAWNDLQQAVRDQRSAIVQRELDAVWAVQDRLQELLGRVAALQEQSSQLRPALLSAAVQELERHLGGLRRQARDGLRLNQELLRDICSYLDMMREVVLPPVARCTYSDPRGAQRGTGGAHHSWSRTA